MQNREEGDNLLIDIVEIWWEYGILMGHEWEYHESHYDCIANGHSGTMGISILMGLLNGIMLGYNYI